MSDYWYAGGGIGLGPAVADYVRTAYPEPELPAHLQVITCCPYRSAVTGLFSLAVERGWQVKITHARGCFPHATTGAPGGVQDSLAVRMRQGAQRAVAVYAGASTWSWGTIARWDMADPRTPDRFDSITAFQDFLDFSSVWGWPTVE